jgi:hypothetical protein
LIRSTASGEEKARIWFSISKANCPRKSFFAFKARLMSAITPAGASANARARTPRCGRPAVAAARCRPIGMQADAHERFSRHPVDGSDHRLRHLDDLRDDRGVCCQ